MARRIYIVELEVEADDEADLPEDDSLVLTVERAVKDRTTRFGAYYELIGTKVVGKREG